MLLLANLLATSLFTLACAVLTAVLLRKTYKRLAKHRRPRNEPAIAAQPRPTSEWSGAHADASARIERQKVELHEQTREATARIDNKLVILQQLIAKSQSQIERLEALLSAADEAAPRIEAGGRS